MLGAVGFGYLADRIGRRRLFAATLILYSGAAVLTATSWNFGSFMAFRFPTALGVGGEAVSSAMAEFVPDPDRGRAAGGIMNAWSVGGGAISACLNIYFARGLTFLVGYLRLPDTLSPTQIVDLVELTSWPSAPTALLP